MPYRVEGDYFEACNCDVSCPCIFLGPATEDRCLLFLAWRVTSGEKDGIDLSGLSAALAVDSPKRMTDGGWRVALYLDERATPAQADAMRAIFSGEAGGYLAAVAPLIGEVTGVHTAPISFEADGTKRGVTVGDVLEVRAEQSLGLDGSSPTVIANPPLMAVPQPVRQGKSTEVMHHGPWAASFSGRNAFITEFAYEG
jgi:hypothetical protein